MTAAARVGVLCDLDGTLADTAPSIHRAGQLMLADVGAPEVGFEDSRRFVGDGLPRYVKRLLTGEIWGEPDPQDFERAVRLMREHYYANLTWECRLYPGVGGTLDRLESMGCPLGCVTNKPEKFARPLLEHLGIAGKFHSFVGGDTLAEKKPHPLPVRHCLGELGVGAADAVFVGDGPADSKACASAGVCFVAVSYGYSRYPVGSEHFSPDCVIGDFSELAGIVSGMARAVGVGHG